METEVKKELISSFTTECGHAKELLDLLNNFPDSAETYFTHVSNADMETTIRTIRSIYLMVRKDSQ